MAITVEKLAATALVIVMVAFSVVTVDGQFFMLRNKAYRNHGLVLIDDIGTSCSLSSLNCISDNKTCCSLARSGEYDFPNGSAVPVRDNIRDGYYRNRGIDRVSLHRINGTVQGIFRCRITTLSSPGELRDVYIGIYDANSGMPVVTSVTWDGQQTLSCNSSGGPATYVTWRRNCAVLPNNDTYLQTRTVTQGQTATYNNTLVIDPAPPSGVYTCSVTNIRGYSNGAVGVGDGYSPELPLPVTVILNDAPVAGRNFTLTCIHATSVMNPVYLWLNGSGNSTGSEATLSFTPLLESNSGEYSCMVTDGNGRVGCGVERLTVQAPNLTVIVEGADNVTTGSTHTLTCSVSGVNLAAVTSLSYTWFYNGVEKQSLSASNQFSTGIVQLPNAGDEYSCQVKVKASYWDASGSFRGTGSGVLSVTIPRPSSVTVTTSPAHIQSVESNISILCTVEMSPVVMTSDLSLLQLNIRLSRKGTSLTLTSQRVTTETTYTHTYLVDSATTCDSGEYTCTATVIPQTPSLLVTGNGALTGKAMINIGEAVPLAAASTDAGKIVGLTIAATLVVECLIASPFIVTVGALCYRKSRRFNKQKDKKDTVLPSAGHEHEDPDQLATTAMGNYEVTECLAYESGKQPANGSQDPTIYQEI